MRPRSLLLPLLFLLAIAGVPSPSRAVTLTVGDIVVAVGDSVVHIDGDTLAETVVSSGGLLTSTRGPAVSAWGEIYVADEDTNSVVRIDPVTGQQTLVSSGGLLLDPRDVEIAGNGQLIVGNGLPGLLSIAPSDGTQTDLGSEEDGVFGVVVESSGDSIVFTSFFNGIWRMDLTTLDETTVLTPGFANFGPLDLAVDGAGDVWSSEGEAIVKRDPITGDPIETIAGPENGFILSHLAFDPDGRLLVQTEFLGIYRYDPIAEDWEPLSGLTTRGIAVVTPEPSLALLLGAALLVLAAGRRSRPFRAPAPVPGRNSGALRDAGAPGLR